MAKIFFVGLDGTEKSYRLQTHRPFTLGRDPGNDIILRDPKVSRHHAEIVFERGFFVLHDLASANGTYVNGKRIRVAPLTHGARLRMGNTYGRFSEELPTENESAPIAAVEPFDQPVPQTEDLGNLEMLPTATIERVNPAIQTLPHDKLSASDLKKKSGVAQETEGPTEPLPPRQPEANTNPAFVPPPPPAPKPVVAPSGPFTGTTYQFETGLRAGETATVRDGADKVLLTYRSFASVVPVVAALVCGLVLVAGLVGALFLIEKDSFVLAVVALVLTFAFATFIGLLVPRTNVTLYADGNPALSISQRSVFPSATFIVATPNGATLATLHKSFLSRLGRNRWTITQEDRFLGDAIEESFSGAIVRKMLGKFSRRFETNVQIQHGGVDVGSIVRRPDGERPVDVLELTSEGMDRRVAVALATLILGREP